MVGMGAIAARRAICSHQHRTILVARTTPTTAGRGYWIERSCHHRSMPVMEDNAGLKGRLLHMSVGVPESGGVAYDPPVSSSWAMRIGSVVGASLPSGPASTVIANVWNWLRSAAEANSP